MRLPFERFPMRTAVVLAVGALATIGIAALAMRAGASSHATAEESVVRPARVMTVEYRDAARSLVLAGTVVPRIESTLGFRVAGKIVRRAVDVGAVVKPGEVIAELDPADFQLAVDNALAALA